MVATWKSTRHTYANRSTFSAPVWVCLTRGAAHNCREYVAPFGTQTHTSTLTHSLTHITWHPAVMRMYARGCNWSACVYGPKKYIYTNMHSTIQLLQPRPQICKEQTNKVQITIDDVYYRIHYSYAVCIRKCTNKREITFVVHRWNNHLEPTICCLHVHCTHPHSRWSPFYYSSFELIVRFMVGTPTASPTTTKCNTSVSECIETKIVILRIIRVLIIVRSCLTDCVWYIYIFIFGRVLYRRPTQKMKNTSKLITLCSPSKSSISISRLMNIGIGI